MKLIPAIDLKEGKCVRLSEGKQESSVVYNKDPVKQAKFFESTGCERIHIVDLDAAFGNKDDNRSIILEIRNSISIDIELGGGIRTDNDVAYWIKKKNCGRSRRSHLSYYTVALFQKYNHKKYRKRIKEKKKI